MLQRHTKLAFEGSIHFVTTVTSARGRWFVTESHCQDLLGYFEAYREQYGVLCHGYVLMPDHLHALLSQVTREPIIPKLMQSFKKITSRYCRQELYPEARLWHYRYDDVPVPGSDAARTRLEYMHNNPIRCGLCERDVHYKWSSARDYIEGIAGIVQISRL